MQLLDFEKSRKEVLAVLAGKVNTVIAIKVVEALKKATIEAEPVRHGRWIVTKEYNDVIDMDVVKYACSACGEYRLSATTLSQATNYCPNCGAKMDGDNHGNVEM